jgi:succinate-semialdehyde dehydrogenase / glutarate-semialdehyde dehydrogenase
MENTTSIPHTSNQGRLYKDAFLSEQFPDIHNLEKMVRVEDGPHELTTVRIPADGKILGTVPISTVEDVKAALGRSRSAQVDWARTSLEQRKSIFLRFHDLVMKNRDGLLDLLQLEAGKTRLNALEEVLDVAINSRYYASRTKKYLKARQRKGAFPLLTHTMEFYRPVGVVGFISPWNYPLAMAVSDSIPAMIAGNSVILKPAEETPFSALFGAKLLYEAGVPRDVFQVVTGKGRDISPTLLEGIDFLSFTGGTATGSLLAREAGEHLIKCSMELGGKNPAIVLDDASLDKTVEGVLRGAFSNAGQLCVHIERLFVQSGIYDQFVDALVKRTREMKVSGALDFNVDMSSLLSQTQLDKIKHQIADAVGKGASILTGGKALPELGPYFHEPTIMTNVKPGMVMFAQETFGPVLAVYRFNTDEDAIRLANDSMFGLNASIWTRNVNRAQKIAGHIKAGTVNINEAYAATWGSVDSPMGGMKASGLGRRHGREGILKYTESQTVATQSLIPIGPFGFLPAQRYAAVITWILKLMKTLPFLR